MFERAGRARTGCGTEMVARKNVSKIKKLAGGFVGESRGVSGYGNPGHDVERFQDWLRAPRSSCAGLRV